MEQLGGSRIIARAEGSRIYDADGRELLDGMAGLWCVNVGYGREELARAAYDQMLRAALLQYFLQDGDGARRAARYAAGRSSLAASSLISSSAIPDRKRTTRRCVSARHYWAVDWTAEAQDRHQPLERLSRIHRGGGESRRHEVHARAGRPADSRYRALMQPYWFGEGFGESPSGLRGRAANAHRGADPRRRPGECRRLYRRAVQGAGGVIIPPAGYWPRVEAICRRHGIL